jgi:hypothetical protein
MSAWISFWTRCPRLHAHVTSCYCPDHDDDDDDDDDDDKFPFPLGAAIHAVMAWNRASKRHRSPCSVKHGASVSMLMHAGNSMSAWPHKHSSLSPSGYKQHSPRFCACPAAEPCGWQDRAKKQLPWLLFLLILSSALNSSPYAERCCCCLLLLGIFVNIGL